MGCDCHIELFFRVLKQGRQIERLRLATDPRLLNAIAIYLIIAWRIHRGRLAPSGARPSTGPEKRSAPRAGQRLGGAVASRWRPQARSLRGRDRRS
jgi:hypothetical protein